MKKIILSLCIFIMSVVTAFSQVDTLHCRQHEPTYYYWDNHYADYYGCGGELLMNGGDICATILARYCFIDTSLRVIGVAAPATSEKIRREYWYQYPIRDTLDIYRVPEYFQLYNPTDSGMILLAEARWDTNHPRYRMYFPQNVSHYALWYCLEELEQIESYPLVYEAYFDKPITVHDSFYVAATTYNSDLPYDDSTGTYRYMEHYRTLYYSVNFWGNINQDRLLLKYTNPFDRNIDPNLDYLRYYYRLGWFDPRTDDVLIEGDFLALFPIFDTTGLDIHGFRWVGECDSVRSLRLLYIEDGKAYISWNAGPNSRWWEISYGEPGFNPDRGTKDTSLTSLVCLDSLRPGRRYEVYVRERCKDDTRGPWGESITFTMPGSSEVLTPTLVDRHTHVMPNPTGGMTTVISGFKISTIEVYNMAGAQVETIKMNANTGTIDLSNLPSGTYILRIRTTHGDTAKRIVKQTKVTSTY